MIDFGKIRLNGRLNYQNGMLFYFSGHGRVISFYIDDIRSRNGKTRVTMHPDVEGNEYILIAEPVNHVDYYKGGELRLEELDCEQSENGMSIFIR